MIEIKTFFKDWEEVSEEYARAYITCIMPKMTAMKEDEKIEWIESKRLRGITVKELLKEQTNEKR